ncbi:hypothetical protein A9Z42_0088400 [Trichoderma parareesei]|uniref:Zinc finger C2H2 LYAR-type domain-containing protein n=1 Tax=Trichoderma parareesei TaxID=858221 RepID=A0A2H2ZM94_TRIPA|nr:hypothetical protein A9Z42_0088400 [Trichoderma parareesei]
MVYFPGFEYRSHTTCMTEEQKYQGALYKPKQNKKQQPQQQQQQQQQQQKPAMNSHRMGMANTLALQPFVEDVNEDKEYESWHEYEIRDKSATGPPPEAPTPPSAADDEHVNVFDFLDNSQTPTASNVSRTRDPKPSNADDNTSLVRYETKTGELLEPASLMDQDGEPLVQYGTGPVPTADFVTPKPKTERRRSKDRDAQKDKKRKRLHIDVAGDQIMADAPPVLHSGLTGGLKNMMRPTLPPSPDYSGDNIADLSPASPVKKSKHSRHHKSHHHHHQQQSSTSIFGLIAGAPPKPKSSKRKSSSKKHSHKHDKKSPKLIEYRPGSKDGKGDHDGQMVVFKPRADVFLSFVNKGPESERGCSMNKALKRFHRERQAAGDNIPKIKEEKELWRSLRLRRNDRGEIVLFCEE